mmetsp:Transcript_3663/g.4868  ORF Transcript_3663/g.4868 Transcript_3663/m.4868 type:complete len:161 (+) Transcript_3663:1041-1523(+)
MRTHVPPYEAATNATVKARDTCASAVLVATALENRAIAMKHDTAPNKKSLLNCGRSARNPINSLPEQFDSDNRMTSSPANASFPPILCTIKDTLFMTNNPHPVQQVKIVKSNQKSIVRQACHFLAGISIVSSDTKRSKFRSALSSASLCGIVLRVFSFES